MTKTLLLLQANIEARNNNFVTIARHLKFTRKQLFETQSENAEPDDSSQVIHCFLVMQLFHRGQVCLVLFRTVHCGLRIIIRFPTSLICHHSWEAQ